ncbi:MAG: hypothetical protein A4E32_00533 [Methanomassiliicoccales archaeon PtaU1.Bin124]|nr:MAG: hypothetical protein A4E32_00533 [Methanomassiliicoccales archaeon PtaU1.Bin124]
MQSNNEIQNEEGPLLPWYLTGVAAIVAALVLVLLAALGPLGLDIIQYRSSQSAIDQIAGNDLANIVLTIPLLIIGGSLELLRRPGAKYFLVLTPISVFYYALSIGLAQEWSSPVITGNVEQYFWLFLILIVCSLFMLIGSITQFSPQDAPHMERKTLQRFAIVTGLFLTMFAVMWVSQVVSVQQTGNLPDGSYTSAPSVFWTIRYLDLGITVPLGFLALGLLVTKPRKAYALVLLLMGFMVNTGTAVNTMAAVMFLKNDPTADPVMAAVFLVLGVLSYCLLYVMVKDKLHWHPQRDGTSAAKSD